MMICDFCLDHDATHVVDSDRSFGGGESGPAYDAPVYCVACPQCLAEHGSAYMDPEPITDAWERFFARPWTFYDPPHAPKVRTGTPPLRTDAR